MSDNESGHEAEVRTLLRSVMKRQATLGVRVASVFLIIILGLPLFNLFFPRAAALPIFGFSLTWLFLGVLFFPITWALSSYFVRESDRIEADAAAEAVRIRKSAYGENFVLSGVTAADEGASK